MSSTTSTGDTSTGGEGVCGDTLINGDEECDDGNLESFDGCSAGCGKEELIVQVCAGAGRTCALDAQARVKCWGANLYGELGIGVMGNIGDDPGEMGANLPFVELGMEVKQMTCANTLCALGVDGQVKCWGGGDYLGLGMTEMIGDDPGEMGDALPAVDLGEPAVAITSGGMGQCALLASGAVRCWGNNSKGQLGLGDTETRGDEPGEMGLALPAVDLGDMQPRFLAGGHSSNCAVDDLGRIKCWGRGHFLGLEDWEDRGDEPGEMGDALPFVDVGTGAIVAQAAASNGIACVVQTDGRLKCWGADEGSNVLWPFSFNFYGINPGEMGDNLPAYDLGDRKAVAVQTGLDSACVLLDDKSVKCWGDHAFGIMGTGTGEQWPGEPLAEVPAIDLGVGETVEQLSHGFQHACALLSNGRVKCWGQNGGQLGYEDDNDRGDEPGEMGDALPYVEIY